MTTPNESTNSTESTEGQTPEEQQTTEQPTDQTGENGTGEQENPEGEKKPEDDLPEWARKELTSVRGEAANYRTRLREAEKKLSEAKTPEDIEAAVKDLREQNAALERSLMVTTVARKYELPDDLAEELNLLPAEKVEERAKVLAKYAKTASAPGPLSGGLTPDDGDDGEMDPRKLARRTRRV